MNEPGTRGAAPDDKPNRVLDELARLRDANDRLSARVETLEETRRADGEPHSSDRLAAEQASAMSRRGHRGHGVPDPVRGFVF